MSEAQDYYSVLGVLPTADIIVIRAAYRALAQIYHPDTRKIRVGHPHAQTK